MEERKGESKTSLLSLLVSYEGVTARLKPKAPPHSFVSADAGNYLGVCAYTYAYLPSIAELVARWKPCRRLLGLRGAPKESSCYGLQRVQGGQKVGLLRSETMPKQFPNNSKKTSKKSRNRLFWPPKWPNLESQSGQKVSIFESIFDLRALFLDFLWWKKK